MSMSVPSYIVVLNCGSSSIKFGVFEASGSARQPAWNGKVQGIGGPHPDFGARTVPVRSVDLGRAHPYAAALQIIRDEILCWLNGRSIAAIAHRVVHGGAKYFAPTRVDEQVLAELKTLIPLAPLHNPANLTGIRAAQTIFPGLPNVGVFDTAFHQTMPEHAYTYAVPRELYRKHGLRRYGFHGTSYRYVAQEAANLLGKDLKDTALVIAHLGNGASVAAVLGGESKDTSMGLTPLEGLVMGTRSGDLDPGAFGFIEEATGLSAKEVTDMLNKKSGLLGISELSNDMRSIQEAAADGHEGAQLALEVTAYRLAKYIASMTVATGRLDAIVFTGGIGENSSLIRAKTIGYLGILGIEFDDAANEEVRFGKAGFITRSGTAPAVLVVPTNEERMIAFDTLELSGVGK